MNSALLTIDDVSSRNTPAIVDYLNSKGIKAILFAVGENVERFYDEAIYAVQHGMIVGNHSYSHAHFSQLSVEEGIADIEKCEAVLDRLYRDSGVERIFRPFRFPYGDKGEHNKAALQAYLKEKRFDKVDDRHIPYPWWREYGMDQDIDTFWSFDFEEYRVHLESTFTKENVWHKMHHNGRNGGTPLFGEGNRHILLMHAFDETDAVWPGYYREIIDQLLENGMVFDEPHFLKIK